MERITDPSKTRGQIIRELKRQELIESAKDLKKPKRFVYMFDSLSYQYIFLHIHVALLPLLLICFKEKVELFWSLDCRLLQKL